MKILVFNGSPKGVMSITYHHVLFLEKHYKNIEFEFIHIGQLYKKLSDSSYVKNLIDRMVESDAVLWSYPVYTFSVPYQLMRLFESLLNHHDRYKLKDIKAFQLSTSKHFYDTTAYDYVHQCTESLQMKHMKGHKADMLDLLEDRGRKLLVSFFDEIVVTLEEDLFISKRYQEHKHECYGFKYQAQAEPNKLMSSILVIYNGEDYSETLKEMIEAYDNLLSYQIHLLDLSNFDIKGGCLGCIKCTFTGHCVYKDDFEKMYHEKVAVSDVIIYASDIKNHWLHSDFKCFHDRTFYNGHRVHMEGKAVGYLLTGPYRDESTLQTFIEATSDVSQMYQLDVVTNEDENILEKILHMVHQTEYFMKKKPAARQSFYSVGGMKIFRDLVYSYRGMMHQDHEFYKKHDLYDFPKRSFLKQFFIRLGMMYMANPKRFKKYGRQLNESMIKKYKEQIEKY